jgi:hypothetical protein
VIDAASTGPYTLLGTATYGEFEVLNDDTAVLKGVITASQSFSTDLWSPPAALSPAAPS